MADNVILNAATGTFTASTSEVDGAQIQHFRLDLGAGAAKALAAGTLPISGTVSTGGLTDAQLRASALSVTFTNATLAVTGPLTDAQLRATALPVSIGGTVTVTGALTDAQLRAAAVPVSAASLPLPTGAATEATLAAMNAKLPAAGQALAAASQPVVLASDQSAIPISEAALVLTGQATQTATVNNILTATSGAAASDVSNYCTASVQVVSTGTAGTFIFEQSNDNVNFVALPVFNAALVTGVPITGAITASASQIVYTFPIRCRHIRLRIATTITGGSIQAFSRISTEPWTAAAQLVASNTGANLAVSGTVTANAGTGTLAVSMATQTPTLAAGTALTGDVGIQYRANATGAASFVNFASPVTPAGTQVKTTGGRVVAYELVNTSAGVRWVKFFNVASAPTMGTTSAAFEVPIPASGRIMQHLPGGLAFGTGCFVAVTSARGLTDNTTTGLALGDVSGYVAFA